MEFPEKLIKKLLTLKEKKTLQKRFKIINMLKTGLTYREISQKMGISTTTVVRLNQRLRIRKANKKKKYSFRHAAAVENGYKNQEKSKLPWVIG